MTPPARAGQLPGPTDTSWVHWQPCVRVAGFRTQPAEAFERAVDPADVADVLAIRDAGRRPSLDPGDVVMGPGARWVMAPFVRVSPDGTRFSDGTFGAYYAARDELTAVAEVRFHHARALARTAEPPTLLGGRLLLATLDAALVDIRGRKSALAELYDPDPGNYPPAQRWGRAMREAGSVGIVYDSVRRAGGECAAVFRPRALSGCVEGDHIAYEWDGARITTVHRLTRID